MNLKNSMKALPKYYQAIFKERKPGSLFLEWNWGAFLFGPIWLLYRGMLVYSLLSILLLIVAPYLTTYSWQKCLFILHIALAYIGTSLFGIYLKQRLGNDVVDYTRGYSDDFPPAPVLRISSKKKERELENVKEQDLIAALKNIVIAGNEEYIVLSRGDDFMQTYVTEYRDDKKLYHIEYRIGDGDLYYQNEVCNEEKAIELFLKFFNKDKSYQLYGQWLPGDF